MSAQTATVTLRIDAKQADALAALLRTKGALADVGTAGQQAGTKAAAGLDKVEKSIESAKRAVLGLAAGISVFTVGRQLIQTADGYKNITAQLKAATGDSLNFASAQQQVFSVAQRTNTALGETTVLTAKITKVLRDMGQSNEAAFSQSLGLATTLNQMFAIAGTSAADAESAIRQFNQALNKSKFNGDELVSIFENAPGIVDALTASLGKSKAELLAMGEAGTLSAELVLSALKSQAGATEAAFNKIPVTVSRAYQQLGNALSIACHQPAPVAAAAAAAEPGSSMLRMSMQFTHASMP